MMTLTEVSTKANSEILMTGKLINLFCDLLN